MKTYSVQMITYWHPKHGTVAMRVDSERGPYSGWHRGGEYTKICVFRKKYGKSGK